MKPLIGLEYPGYCRVHMNVSRLHKLEWLEELVEPVLRRLSYPERLVEHLAKWGIVR